MRRAAAALAVVLAAAGCTATTVGADGERRGPVHIETSPTGDPSQGPGKSQDDGKSGKGNGDGKNRTKSSEAPAEVLWSRGDEGRDVRELQSRLRQVAWLFDGPTGQYDDLTVQAVKGFQGKRGLPKTGSTDSVTWSRLVKMTREPTKWELYAFGGQPADAPDPRCMTGRVLCISKSSRTMRWMIDGRTLSTVEVRFGSQYTPTREGVFSVSFKSRHHVSTLYDTPMPYAMFFSGGQAVHYSSDFAARGYYGASHGCVNVRDEPMIADLFQQVRNGDKVVVHW